jgi:hypothetical protein
MTGVWMEVRSSRLCTACLGRGREEYLKNLIIDDGPLSSLIARCFACNGVETKAAAVGNDLRARLLKSEKRAGSRVLKLMAVGALLALGAMAVAASALAAIQ